MAHRVPATIETAQDPLHRMRAYQIAEALMADAYEDAKLILVDPIARDIAPQLYEAICGIEANISEAYSRSSGKDRALRFEYALGEVRECMSWYKGAMPILGGSITTDRRNRLEEIRRMLLAIIPRERGKTMR